MGRLSPQTAQCGGAVLILVAQDSSFGLPNGRVFFEGAPFLAVLENQQENSNFGVPLENTHPKICLWLGTPPFGFRAPSV